MNKQQFLNIMKQQLNGIPDQDKKEILFDYNEHFDAGLNEGREEEEIARSLGNPKSLAKEIKASYMITKVEEKLTVTNFGRALFATMGLGFFNLVFILGPFIAISSVLLSLLISGIAITFSGIAVFIGTFIEPIYPDYISLPFEPVVAIFISIFLTCLGLLWTIGGYALNKGYFVLVIKYLKFNINIITNRRVKYE